MKEVKICPTLPTKISKTGETFKRIECHLLHQNAMTQTGSECSEIKSRKFRIWRLGRRPLDKGCNMLDFTLRRNTIQPLRATVRGPPTLPWMQIRASILRNLSKLPL